MRRFANFTCPALAHRCKHVLLELDVANCAHFISFTAHWPVTSQFISYLQAGFPLEHRKSGEGTAGESEQASGSVLTAARGMSHSSPPNHSQLTSPACST